MLRFSEVRKISHKDFKEAIKIYEDSFPANERQPVDIIKKRIKKNLYQMFIGCLDGEVVFMALLYELKNTDFVLLDYMATKENFRGKGIGQKFVENMKKELKLAHLILEIENPKYGNNREQRQKRVKFYRQLGAKELKDINYILPPLSGDIPTEMILMILLDSDEGKMEGNLVKKLITQIYKELYNRDENDEFLNKFISKVKRSIELV